MGNWSEGRGIRVTVPVIVKQDDVRRSWCTPGSPKRPTRRPADESWASQPEADSIGGCQATETDPMSTSCSLGSGPAPAICQQPSRARAVAAQIDQGTEGVDRVMSIPALARETRISGAMPRNRRADGQRADRQLGCS